MSTTRRSRRILGTVALVATVAVLPLTPASADPNNDNPGTFPVGKAADQIFTTVGADAFAELTNNITIVWNAQDPAPSRVLASYDAVNPVTAVAGESITTKPGCPIARPNGANAAITAIKLNQASTTDPSEYCIDWVRASRAKATNGSDNALTFFAQSRDAVGYATVGNAYAPTTPLTKAQLKDIFECTVDDWSEVGGQAGAIRVYLPAASAATLTFFLQAIGSSLTNVTTGCGSTTKPNQQNDGRSLDGDPQGIAPYTVTKYAAQGNNAPGIPDYRGGAVLGGIITTAGDTPVPLLSTTTFEGKDYQVLNSAFVTANPSFSRLFFNAVRNQAVIPAVPVAPDPNDPLYVGNPTAYNDAVTAYNAAVVVYNRAVRQRPLYDSYVALFGPSGYICSNQEKFLVPYGNTPLGANCGQAF